MTLTSAIDAIQTETLKVLIVDDNARDRKLIKETLNVCPWLVSKECGSPAEVAALDPTETFDVCILDIRFGDVVEIWNLLEIVNNRFPQALLIILSDYLGELDERTKQRVADSIAKPSFKLDRSVLRTSLIEALRESSALDPLLKERVIGHFEELNERDEREHQELLFETTGYVLEVRRPFIEVMIEEPQTAFDRLTRFVTRAEPQQKRLLMRYDVFKACGILGQDMRFRFRVVREGRKIISEVLPVEEKVGAAPLPLKLDEKLIRLKALQAEKRKELGSNDG